MRLLSQALLPEKIAVFQELRKQCKVPGAVLTLIQGGKIARTAALGFRDEAGSPMEEDTLFESASLTKPFFSVLIMQAAEQGKIDLDGPIPSFPGKETWSQAPAFSRITPRQCLSHGSGLPNWAEHPMKLRFSPGTGFGYSGEGYYLLQKGLEYREQKPLPLLFKERIFDPLGLSHCFVVWEPEMARHLAHGFSMEGTVNKIRTGKDESGPAPEPNAAWSLYASSPDYARFLCALFLGNAGLSAASFREMTAVQNNARGAIAWGLGFGLMKKFPSVIWHWGDNTGFQSLALLDKETGDGAVIHTNSDGGKHFYLALLPEIMDTPIDQDLSAFLLDDPEQ